ncbi:MAG: MerR family DNA-binding protein [Planctomycetota bacterium]|nr:MerR family DNA-binding protein [Planctomycetota bacterium]
MKQNDELLGLRVDPETTCADVREKARAKIQDMEEKIRDLERMKKTMERLTASCRGRGPTRECPILGYLDNS